MGECELLFSLLKLLSVASATLPGTRTNVAVILFVYDGYATSQKDMEQLTTVKCT